VLTAVLQTGACEANVGSLLSRGAVGFPAEDGEGSRADLAFCAIVLLQHLHVLAIRQAFLADGREVGCLPTGSYTSQYRLLAVKKKSMTYGSGRFWFGVAWWV